MGGLLVLQSSVTDVQHLSYRMGWGPVRRCTWLCLGMSVAQLQKGMWPSEKMDEALLGDECGSVSEWCVAQLGE